MDLYWIQIILKHLEMRMGKKCIGISNRKMLVNMGHMDEV